MGKVGGPCQGPGVTEGTVCGATEIADTCDWRKGGKFKPEHVGKPCCTKRACRIFLGVIEVPNAAKKRRAEFEVVQEEMVQEETRGAALEDGWKGYGTNAVTLPITDAAKDDFPDKPAILGCMGKSWEKKYGVDMQELIKLASSTNDTRGKLDLTTRDENKQLSDSVKKVQCACKEIAAAVLERSTTEYNVATQLHVNKDAVIGCLRTNPKNFPGHNHVR